MIMGSLIEGFGINTADRGMEELASGNIGTGVLLVGLAVAENLPGGKALHALPGVGKGWTKLRGSQGWRDAAGGIWKKDRKHKDHWDVSDRKGNKVQEVDFEGNQIWPDGPKNKNKE